MKRATCPDCNNPLEECSDPEKVWYSYRRICYASMEQEAAQAAFNALHGDDAGWHDGTHTSWGAVRSEEFPYPAGAGQAIGVASSDLTPWDKFTTNRDASPVRSVVEESPSDEDEADD